MLALNFWYNYDMNVSLLMSSTAGSNACNPSFASSHPDPFCTSTHNYWWRGGALDHHCVCRSCSTLYCSTSWPLMGGKTPNITTYCCHCLTTTTTLHTHTITSHSVDSSAERNIGRSEENVKLLQIPQQALRTSSMQKLSLPTIQLMAGSRLLHFVSIINLISLQHYTSVH